MATNTDKSQTEFKRWTATRKMEVVLRYMRGELLDSLSREIGIAASQIEEWHQAAVRGIEDSLKSRNNRLLSKFIAVAPNCKCRQLG